MYRKVVIGLLVFALFNSSDMLLLLKVKQSGMADTHVIGLYIFYNLIYALAAFPIGIIADKLQPENCFHFRISSYLPMVYLGMALTANIYIYLVLFFLYGLYAAATEGIAQKHGSATLLTPKIQQRPSELSPDFRAWQQ